MKKFLFIFNFLLVFTFVEAQPSKSIDTIYANSQKNVALFFPKPLRQGITGSSNFVFTYNREKAQYFGLLQASPSKESNLLVITNDGQVYSYILKFKDRLSKMNYFIEEKESIGTEKPHIKHLEPTINSPILLEESEKHRYKKNSAELVSKVNKSRMYSKRNGRIKLSVKDVVFRDQVLYFLLTISNTSVLDYELNFIDFFIAHSESLRKRSFQKNYLSRLYSLGLPTVIKGRSRTEFVLVLPKFSIDRTKKIGIELNELHGERNITLQLPSRFIRRMK